MTAWAVWLPAGEDRRAWVLAGQRYLVDQVDVAATVTTTVSDAREGLQLVGTGAVTGLLVPSLAVLAPVVLPFDPTEVSQRNSRHVSGVYRPSSSPVRDQQVLHPSGREQRPRWLYGDAGPARPRMT